MKLKKAKVPLILLFLPFLFFAQLGSISCVNPLSQNRTFIPWDTTFTISGINFPNDTIFSRSIVNLGSNYRLKSFIEKCQNTDTLRIGFLGGSITAGAISSRQEYRFSTRFCEALKKSFPNLKNVVELNAGIGATTSRFGCSRLKTDLIDRKPDIIFVDYAVNDWGMGDTQYIGSSIEGVIRQCLSFKNDVPLVMLFFAKGDGTNVQDIQAMVGSHYSLPMISYRDAIWPLIQNGKTDWGTFFHDDPHPNDNGHLVAASLLYSLIKKEISQSTNSKDVLPTPIFSDIYQQASILTQSDTSIKICNSTWTLQSREGGRLFFESSHSGDSLILKTTCREITLGIHMQSNVSSNINVVIDSGIMDTLFSNNCSFEYCKFNRLYITATNTLRTIRIYHKDSLPFTIDYILYAN